MTLYTDAACFQRHNPIPFERVPTKFVAAGSRPCIFKLLPPRREFSVKGLYFELIEDESGRYVSEHFTSRTLNFEDTSAKSYWCKKTWRA
jgi:hypothetical protein